MDIECKMGCLDLGLFGTRAHRDPGPRPGDSDPGTRDPDLRGPAPRELGPGPRDNIEDPGTRTWGPRPRTRDLRGTGPRDPDQGLDLGTRGLRPGPGDPDLGTQAISPISASSKLVFPAPTLVFP